MLSTVLPVVIAVSLSAAPKLALLPLSAGEGISEQVSRSVTDALGAELRNQGAQLLTQQDLSAVLSVERQKQLMGCSDSSCMAEIAGALDVDGVVVGSLARLGESYLLSAQYVDSRTGTTRGHASRRKKGGKIDDVLDELPAVAKELLGSSVATVAAPAPTLAASPLPPPHADRPLSLTADERAKLKWLSDGQGHLIAIVPFSGLSGPFLFGDAKALYAQRVFGGGSQGDTEFDVVFWEPRAKVPAEASFELRDGKYTLTCGKSEIPFRPLAAKDAKAAAKQAQLYDVRWQRRGYALARDEDGTYFYVDQAREPDDNTDFRLYVGTQGKLSGQVAEVLAHDASGDVFRAAGSKLKLDLRKGEGEWVAGQGRTRLTVLPIEDHARFVYTQLGAYAGLPLGTPCDLAF